MLARASGFVLAALLASSATASSVDIIGDSSNSTEGLGGFTGTVTYEHVPLTTTGVLTVLLTNTSDADNGGYITAFLFNIASDDAGASALLRPIGELSHPFEQITGNDLSGSPFGDYDAGAGLNGDFLGGGNPTGGVAVGETGSFIFDIDADDAGDLTAMSFVAGGPLEFDFLVRFRGFDDDGSDKVPVAIIPLPAPFAMGGLGLCGVMLLRRRRC